MIFEGGSSACGQLGSAESLWALPIYDNVVERDMDMAETIGLTTGALDRAAALVGAARTDLIGVGGRLTARLAESQSGWRGSGARSFAAFQTTWSDRHRAIVAALDGFEAALRGSEAVSQRADAEQAQTFAGAAAGLE